MELLKVTDKRPDAEIEKLLDATITDAKSNWAAETYDGEYPKTGFGLGKLRPLDVLDTTTSVQQSSINWTLSITAASTWEDWFDVTTSETAYLIITGIQSLDATPNVRQIRPYVDGEDFPIIDIQDLYTLDVARAWFSKPFAVKPQRSFKIRIVADNAGSSDFGLLGYTIAKRGYLIGE